MAGVECTTSSASPEALSVGRVCRLLTLKRSGVSLFTGLCPASMLCDCSEVPPSVHIMHLSCLQRLWILEELVCEGSLHNLPALAVRTSADLAV